jgi:hypothetical protein
VLWNRGGGGAESLASAFALRSKSAGRRGRARKHNPPAANRPDRVPGASNREHALENLAHQPRDSRRENPPATVDHGPPSLARPPSPTAATAGPGVEPGEEVELSKAY